jgi:hypothetical protein
MSGVRPSQKTHRSPGVCSQPIRVVSSMFFLFSRYLTNRLNPTVHSRSSQRGTLPPLLLLCPNHTISSFSQAGSSIHTTTSSSQHLRSSRTNVNLHAYLCRVTSASNFIHAASHYACRVGPVPTSSVSRQTPPACQHF